VEHAAVLRPDQLQRIAQLGVVPTTQSVFFDNMGDGIIGALTPERLQFTYRGKSLLDAGIILPGSSDAPCASESALLGIEKFVTRTTGEGQLFGPRKECLSVREALECYTTGSAAATGFASTKGRLARGYLADFVALGVNLLDAEPETISQTPVRATVLGGKFTYQNL
jgi:predicted amidohydrolase YtcJ